MANRSTRNKIRHSCYAAYTNLVKAQQQLIGVAALADDRSEYIDSNLPAIITALEYVVNSTDKFYQGL